MSKLKLRKLVSLQSEMEFLHRLDEDKRDV